MSLPGVFSVALRNPLVGGVAGRETEKEKEKERENNVKHISIGEKKTLIL